MQIGFLAKKPRELGVEYIYADAWSARAYMKTNNNTLSIDGIIVKMKCSPIL